MDASLPMEAVVGVLRAAGEETRLRLLRLLAFGELSVKDLTIILGQSQPRISRHLKLLDDAGLVRRHREGNWVYCRLDERGPAGRLAAPMLAALASQDRTLAGDAARLAALKSERAAAAERFFNGVADEWDHVRALQVGEGEVEHALLRLAGLRRFGLMLDLGTGTGRMLELFAERIDRGVGIDVSRTMLGHARARLEAAGHHHCELRQGDITSLAHGAGSADLVVLHQVLHYFDDPLPVLREAARVLAPGGLFLIVDFAPHGLEFLRAEHNHRRLGFDRAQMAAWLEETGLVAGDPVELAGIAGAGGVGLTVALWACWRAGATFKAGQDEEIAA